MEDSHSVNMAASLSEWHTAIMAGRADNMAVWDSLILSEWQLESDARLTVRMAGGQSDFCQFGN